MDSMLDELASRLVRARRAASDRARPVAPRADRARSAVECDESRVVTSRGAMDENLLERVAIQHFEVIRDRAAVRAAALACGTPVEQTESFLRDEPAPWVLLDLCISAQSKRWVMQPQRYLASVLANTRLWTLADGTPASAVTELYQLEAFDPQGRLPGPTTIALVLSSRAIQEPNTEAGGTTYEGLYVLRFLLIVSLARVDHLENARDFEGCSPAIPVSLPFEDKLPGKLHAVVRSVQTRALVAEGARWLHARNAASGASAWMSASHGLLAGGISDVTADENGWLAVTPQGVLRLDPDGAAKGFVHAWPKREKRAEALTERRITVTSDGEVFLRTDKRLVSWTAERLRANAAPDVIDLGPIEAISAAHQRCLAVGGKSFYAVRHPDGTWQKYPFKGTVEQIHCTAGAVWIRSGARTVCLLPDGTAHERKTKSAALAPIGDRCLVYQDLATDLWDTSGATRRLDIDNRTERNSLRGGLPFGDELWFTIGRAGHLACVRPGLPLACFALENPPPDGHSRDGTYAQLCIGPGGDLALAARGRVELIRRVDLLAAFAEPPLVVPASQWAATSMGLDLSLGRPRIDRRGGERRKGAWIVRREIDAYPRCSAEGTCSRPRPRTTTTTGATTTTACSRRPLSRVKRLPRAPQRGFRIPSSLGSDRTNRSAGHGPPGRSSVQAPATERCRPLRTSGAPRARRARRSRALRGVGHARPVGPGFAFDLPTPRFVVGGKGAPAFRLRGFRSSGASAPCAARTNRRRFTEGSALSGNSRISPTPLVWRIHDPSRSQRLAGVVGRLLFFVRHGLWQ